jgi:hypothetical protein
MGIGGMLTHPEIVVDDSGQLATEFLADRIIEFAQTSHKTRCVMVMGSTKDLSREAAICIFEKEIERICDWLKEGGNVVVMYDGDPITEVSAASAAETEQEKAERRQRGLQMFVNLRATGQPYFYVDEEGNIRSNSNEAPPPDAESSPTVGIAWFFINLMANKYVRLAEKAGMLKLVQVPAERYWGDDGTGKCATSCRPASHFLLRQKKVDTFKSYRRCPSGFDHLQGGAEVRHGALQLALKQVEITVEFVSFAGGPASRTDLALALGVDLVANGQWMILSGALDQALVGAYVSAVRIYNIPLRSKRTGGEPLAAVVPMGDKRVTLPCDLAAAIVAVNNRSLNESNTAVEVLEQLMKWDAREDVVHHGTSVTQGWVMTHCGQLPRC